MTDNAAQVRYLVSVAFAVLVFAAMFYALVIYEFALPELIQGAFISMGTLAVQYVFGEQVASGAARRAQRSFEAGQSSSGPTVTVAGTDTTTVVDPPVTGSASGSSSSSAGG